MPNQGNSAASSPLPKPPITHRLPTRFSLQPPQHLKVRSPCPSARPACPAPGTAVEEGSRDSELIFVMGVARTTTAGVVMTMIVLMTIFVDILIVARILACPPAAAVTRLVLTGLVTTTIIIIVTTRTMTPEGAAASERLIACPIPNYLGCRVAFHSLVAVGSLSLHLCIYAFTLTLALTWMTYCLTALAVLHTRA